MKKLTLIFLATLLSISLYAQDRIYKHNGEILEVKVLEVGDFEVKYKHWDKQDGVTYIMEAYQIKKILFSEGEVKTFDASLIVPINFSEQRKNAFKVSFLDPLVGSIQFTYEKHLKPGRSMEFSLGYIGIGGDPEYENPKGANLRFGYKFSRTPDYYIRNMKTAHILHGAYIRPDIAFSYFSADDWGSWWQNAPSERQNVLSGALLINFGKQMVFDNAFLVDVYAGVGYGFVTTKEGNEYGYMRWNYGFMAGAEDVPIALNLGVRVGFAYAKK